MELPLSQAAFDRIRLFLRERTGIQLAPARKNLITDRLWRRLWHLRIASYDDYLNYVLSGEDPAETQVMLDLLTTNETSFFREMRHFDFLREHARQRRDLPGPMRVWSAACSTGEEPYSIAMVLDDALGGEKWQVVGSDVSKTVLDAARAGLYPTSALERVPPKYAQRYFTPHGTGGVSILTALRNRVAFKHVNLNSDWPIMGEFDLIFLRNVIIYFDLATRRRLVDRLLRALKPGGFLLTGHAENIGEINEELQNVQPAIYTVAAR